MPNVFDRMMTDARWDGYGYLGGRKSALDDTDLYFPEQTERVAEVDAFLLSIGLDYEALFDWANSSDGRHFADAVFDGNTIEEAVGWGIGPRDAATVLNRVRAIDPGMDTSVVEQIDAMLDRIEADGVRILWAAESGSRAWGFPSPDSGYDVRFIYARSVSDYLSLRPMRDVIEHPVDDTFDVNGWDLRKALRLLVKGNAAAGEWLRSPITYRGDAAARELLLSTAAQVMPFDGLLGHHFHVATNNLDLVRRTGKAKKFLYALREAVTCRWLLAHGPGQVPPMDMPTLIAESGVSAEVAEAAGVLVDVKRRVYEDAGVPVGLTPVLYEFVTGQLATTADYREQHPQQYDAEASDSAWKTVDETFMNLIKKD